MASHARSTDRHLPKGMREVKYERFEMDAVPFALGESS